MQIGLISDTHMPQRCFEFPVTLPQVFSDLDLILHAGDVGELWVLDELSQFAPIIAVHGNDDSLDSQRELPLQQVVTIGGRRILLWHGHYPDRIDELTSRTDELRPKLRRIAQRARRAGASIVVFGHWHLPFAYDEGGILLINPGTIELGNAAFRQLIQTVAILELDNNGSPAVTHIDLANPTEPYHSPIDFDAGFRAALDHFTRDCRSSEIIADSPKFRQAFDQIIPETARLAVFEALNEAAYPVWRDEKKFVTRQDRLEAIQRSTAIPRDVQQKLVDLFTVGE
ncbi:MAG: metallophosphoesterase family protein [Chloroflexota bacterium]